MESEYPLIKYREKLKKITKHYYKNSDKIPDCVLTVDIEEELVAFFVDMSDFEVEKK